MSMPSIPNGYYDDNGEWQRTKFCHVFCGAECTCMPPFGVFYSPIHDKRPAVQGAAPGGESGPAGSGSASGVQAPDGIHVPVAPANTIAESTGAVQVNKDHPSSNQRPLLERLERVLRDPYVANRAMAETIREAIERLSADETRPTTSNQSAGLSKYARDWLVSLRRESGGYPAEVLRHINILEEDVKRAERIADHLAEERDRLHKQLLQHAEVCGESAYPLAERSAVETTEPHSGFCAVSHGGRCDCGTDATRKPPFEPIIQCDTTTARVHKLIEMDAVPSYVVRALLHERDSWRENYWERMAQFAQQSSSVETDDKYPLDRTECAELGRSHEKASGEQPPVDNDHVAPGCEKFHE